MEINLIGVPINYGCDKNGSQYGPTSIMQEGIIDILDRHDVNYNDYKEIKVPKVSEDEKFLSNKNIKYYDAIYQVCVDLADEVYKSLKNQGFPIIIGGDHSLAIGSISGASKYFENLGVVWIDAHGDFNTDEITESKNAHGMPLAVACGYGEENLVNLYEEKFKVEEENVFHIGGRDLDVKEKILMESSDVNIYDKEKIDIIGFEKVLDDIVKKCEEQNLEAIHVSLDIDFLDGLLVPGTGTRVDGGYSLEQLKYILERIFKTGLVRSIDFVEFNPLLDENKVTLEICMELLDYIIDKYKENDITTQ